MVYKIMANHTLSNYALRTLKVDKSLACLELGKVQSPTESSLRTKTTTD